MKNLILLISIVILAGCGTSLFNTSGQAHYTYSKCKGDTCVKIDLLNTKDIKSLDGTVEISPDGTVKIQLNETDANASNLAEINASNQKELINVVKSLVPDGS